MSRPSCFFFHLAATTLLFLMQAASVSAQGGKMALAADIDQIMEEARKSWQVPGAAVVVVHNDRVIYCKGSGVTQLGGKKKVTPDTVFALASGSKPFTTLALAMLVDDGKMAWDDPVRKHVEFFHLYDPLADAEVTLRDLVTHRTGVGGHDLLWYRAPWGLEEMIRMIGRVKPSLSFRSGFEYQSIMFSTAGYAVGKASGSSWEDFMQKRIFGPLGMKNTTVTTTAIDKDLRASPHRKNKDGKVVVIPWYEMTRPNPAGSINSSARDLGQWLRFQLGDGTFDGKRLVSEDNLEEMHSPQIVLPLDKRYRVMHPFTHQMSYGLGWVIQDYRGQLLLSHGGSIDGFRAHMALVPKAKLGIALLNNLDQTQMNLAVSNSIIDLVLGLPYKDWNDHFQDLGKIGRKAADEARQAVLTKQHKGTRPSLKLVAYTGTYEDPAYGKARVILEKDRLVWQWSTFRAPMEHFHFDTFVLQDEVLEHTIGRATALFRLNEDGEVEGMRVIGREFRKVSDK
jgi:CubicO group peptidase (beta-lactamase class C family)